MAMATLKEQTAFDEQVIDDAELLQELDEIQRLKDQMAPLKAKIKVLDSGAKAKIEKAVRGDKARLGRWVLTRKLSQAGHVEFDTEAKVRIRYSVPKEKKIRSPR